jgi:outer membrane protein
MNQFMRILSIVIFVFTIMFISCDKPASTGAAATTAPSVAKGKTVWVNIDTLINQYDLTKDQRDSLTKVAEKAERSFSVKAESFQKRYMATQKEVYDIQQRAQTIPPVEMQALEAKFKAKVDALSKEEAQLNEQRARANDELNKRLADVDKDLVGRINSYLEKISKEKGYDYILMKGGGGGVLYGNKDLDVTAEIVTALNAEYKKTKK